MTSPLQTRYLGLTLPSPLVASASPLSQDISTIRWLEDAGVGAVVLYSLFEEQLRHEAARDLQLQEAHEESFAESLSYFPDIPSGPHAAATPTTSTSVRYLDLVERASQAVDIPVIASLNGSTDGGWVDFARQLSEAGAAALELNIYLVPGDLTMTSTEIEQRHLDILRHVRDAVDLPIAVKLSPYFSSFGRLAVALDQAGADGLVLFNRFLQPEIDGETLSVAPGVELSSPFEGRLPRTWIAALRGRVACSLAGTSGVWSGLDVAKYLLAGADVAMTASALLRHGPEHAAVILAELRTWMDRKHLANLDALRGMLAVPTDVDATDYQRSGYVAALEKAKQTYGSLAAPSGC